MSLHSRVTATWTRVAFETMVILDIAAIVAAAGLWLSRPWWENVSAPSVTVAETWAPMRLGNTGWMCWRPLEWALRHQGVPGNAQTWQWDAGLGGRLVIVVEHSGQVPNIMLAQELTLDSFLRVLSQRPGFAASPVAAVATAALKGQFVTFSYWQFGGLQPIAWCGWIFRASDSSAVWTACATAPKQGWETFSASAWKVVASLCPLRQSERTSSVRAANE